MTSDSSITKNSRRHREKSDASSDAQAVFYAWYRQGLPTGLGNVWTTPTATLLNVLNSAIEQGIIPEPKHGGGPRLRAEIERIKTRHTRKRRKRGSAITAQLRDLLATLPVPLQPSPRLLAAAKIARLRTDDAELLVRLGEFPALQGHVVQVARTLRLAALTGGHVPLVGALQRRLARMKESEGSLRSLTALRRNEWLNLIEAHGTPIGATITPSAFADALMERVEELYPSAALRQHFLQRRRLARLPALREVAKFAQDNPGSDLLSAEPETLLREARPRRRSKRREEELIRELRNLQRVFVLTPRFDEVKSLLADDLNSAAQLLAVGVHGLSRRLKGKIPLERITYLCRQAAFLLVRPPRAQTHINA